jgi:Ser/Thr protein kinase RdoA (MazF antagonist)
MLDRPLAAFARVVTHRPDVATELQEVADALHPRIATLPVEPPGFGLIHGDVIPSNAQVTPQGDVAVLDFDFCGDGWRVYDVATYLWEVRFWQTPWEAARAFLDGYQEVRPLAGWEEDALPVFETARGIVALGTPALHADTWGSAYLSDRLIERLLVGIRQSFGRIQ